MTRTPIGVLAWGLFAAAALAGDWPQFRGPQGQGAVEEAGLPAKWSATENVKWKVDLPGRGLSCPAVAGGRVYVTACTGPEETTLHVLCFDAASGKKLWERTIKATGDTLCHPKTCMAAPSPVADAAGVHALFATGDLVSFDSDGNLRWYRSLVNDYPTVVNHVGAASSPILYKDLLIVLMDNDGESFVAGIDVKDGRNRWKVDRTREVNWTTPALFRRGSDTDLLVLSRLELTAYDPATGKVRWRHKGGDLSSVPMPVVGEDTVFAPAGELLALKPISDTAPPEVAWRSNKLRTGMSTPLYHRGRLYAATDAGTVVCASAATGKELWRERVKGPFSASPVAADGKLFVVNEKGVTTVLRLGDKPEVLATNPLGEDVLATPAIANGCLFLRTDGRLYCIGAK